MSGTTEKDQKTEQPTAKKLSDSAREGDVLMSRELATALAMLAAAGWMVAAGGWFVQSASDLLRRGLTLTAADVADFAPAEALMRNGAEILLPLASLFALALGAAVAGPAMLGSMGWRGKALHFKGNRMNPMSGLKRMFGMQGLTELGKALAKVLLLGTIGYWLVLNSLPAIMTMASTDLIAAIGLAGKEIGHAMLTLAGGLVVIALIDVPVQWFQRNQRLMMSKQEVKEEMRQSDGAPELKQAQRQRAHEILSGSARKAVSDATVVLTNPTHFSVALRYRPWRRCGAGRRRARTRRCRAVDPRARARRQCPAARISGAHARHLFHRARRPRDPRGIVRRGRNGARFRLPVGTRRSRRHAAAPVDVPPSHRFDPEGRRQA
jgi:flagellar biosynthetic protein FlhB